MYACDRLQRAYERPGRVPAGGEATIAPLTCAVEGPITLELNGLHKRYDETLALDGCSFAVPQGRMLGFLGPNGAGKTTAMRCIFGLTRPDAGSVRWRGRAIERAQKRRFGYMPEQRGLYPRMQVLDQLTYFGGLHGLDRHAARSSAARWLDRLGLGDRAQSRLEDLSHGNQQRVQLVNALLHEPELLVLDEPFTGLDPLAVQTLGEVVTEQAAAAPPSCSPAITSTSSKASARTS